MFEGTAADVAEYAKDFEIARSNKIYCAHEYTDSNCKFAMSIDPENVELTKYAEKVAQKRAKNEATIPTSLWQKKK